MKELTAAEKEHLLEEVRKDFPDDEMMQQIHYIRLLHHFQTKGLSPKQRTRFFESQETRLHAQR